MAKVQRLGVNSASKVVELVSELSTDIALPPGVILRGDDEMVIWRQFTRARARDGWRDFDLLIVAKAVRLEADIRKHQKTLDEQGVTLINERGTQIENPMVSVIDRLQRQQLALIRSLSLTQLSQDVRTLNSQGAEKAKLRKAVDSFDDLIAR